MKAKDFIHEQVAAYNLGAAIPSVDADGAAVDLQGFRGGCLFTALVKDSLDTLNGTTTFLELEIEESVDNSTWTDVADGDLSDVVVGTNDGAFAKIIASTMTSNIYQTQYKGGCRYVRCVLNVTGTHTNGTPLLVLSQKLGPDVAPQ